MLTNPSAMSALVIAAAAHLAFEATTSASIDLSAFWLVGGMLAEVVLVNPSLEPGAQYRARDVVHSLYAGISQQLVMVVWLALVTIASRVVLGSVAVEREPLGWCAWVALFAAQDLGYYAIHRMYHEVQVFWVGHSVHHSSNYYNLSAAVRQSWWQGIVSLTLMTAWTLLFPAKDVMRAWHLNLMYQFWLHTCCVHRLPLGLEWVLNSPAHHRVHHDWRVHKNFGGVFIVWDRLFGTFLDEPIYRPACSFGTRYAAPDLSDAVAQTTELARGGVWGAGPGGRGISTASRTLVRSARAPPPLPPMSRLELTCAASVGALGVAAIAGRNPVAALALLAAMHATCRWLSQQ